MGWDYALVHLYYTIPPAILLTVVLAPLLSLVDVYKTCFLITVAVVWTIPWDSYLIHESIWTYPPDGIVGPTLFRIPTEELFFFVIQTYTTSLLYILINKPTLFPIYLESHTYGKQDKHFPISVRTLGQVIISGIVLSQFFVQQKEGTYLRLIFLWAGPVLLLLWSLAYPLLSSLPWSKVVVPIALPTVYLWVVDTLALRNGTWAISHGTKWDIQPWSGMEIEEAVFFLLTNMLVVFGLVAFDNANAIIDIFPSLFPNVSTAPTPLQMVNALLFPPSKYDSVRLQGLRDSLDVLQRKSRSFYLASSVFSGRLRIDLILLYAFCRVADDLVDNASSPEEASEWIHQLHEYLHFRYLPLNEGTAWALSHHLDKFPPEAQRILLQLPTSRISQKPLYELLEGFRMDLAFTSSPNKITNPIKTMSDLETYSYRVAGTVAELCLDLIYFHHPSSSSASTKASCKTSAIQMGKALQYINISRDVVVDAQQNRCYIPTTLLTTHSTDPTTLIKVRGQSPAVTQARLQLLHDAMHLYDSSVDAIEDLPAEARGGIRVAIEAYVEIGRVMLERGFEGVDRNDGRGRKATVPKWRRAVVAWGGMAGWGRGKKRVKED